MRWAELATWFDAGPSDAEKIVVQLPGSVARPRRPIRRMVTEHLEEAASCSLDEFRIVEPLEGQLVRAGNRSIFRVQVPCCC